MWEVKKFLIALFLIVIFPASVMAEGVLQEWAQRYYSGGTDYQTSLAVSAAGDVYVTGFNYGPWWAPSESGYTTVKYSSNGSLLWARKHITGTTHEDSVIKIDSLGNAYMIWSRDTIKYSPNGDVLWIGPGGGAIALDLLDNVYISTGNGIIKFDRDGNELWVKDGGGAIVTDPSGNVYVSGSSITKFDSNGNKLWDRPGGGLIEVDSAENVYTARTDNNDYLATKYDADGNELWVNRFDSGSIDGVTAFTIDSLGNVIVTGMGYYYWDGWGTTTSEFVTVKYDTNGNESWVKRYYDGRAGTQMPFDIAVDSFNNVYVTGTSYGAVIIKYDANGNERWNKRETRVGINDIALDAMNNVYVAGTGDDGWGTHWYQTIKYRQDAQGPTIIINEIETVWPPNGKIIDFPLTGAITDSAGVVAASFTVDDEYGEISLAGNIAVRSDGTFYINIPLEASRRGEDSDGRVYTIHISAMDRVENISSAYTAVKVLHDNGQR